MQSSHTLPSFKNIACTHISRKLCSVCTTGTTARAAAQYTEDETMAKVLCTWITSGRNVRVSFATSFQVRRDHRFSASAPSRLISFNSSLSRI
jgi:hypothetical protein